MIARCHIPAMERAAKTPRTPEAFRALLESFPETCPHADCSPGGCRKAVRDLLRNEWRRRA